MGLAVTLLALALRLAWVLIVPTRPVGDFAMYIESARYLVEHHAFDPEFIYMPGYVVAIAALDAVGGGLLAFKMIGVASGVVLTGAVFGTTRALFGRRAALVAGVGAAVWPAGIAVSSVTGTDMPAAALLALALYLLVRFSAERPWRAALLFGVTLGLAAYVRAVALPLAALAVLPLRARGMRWRDALARGAAGCAAAFLVLLPWGIRNLHRYGELTFTDSHGGHTALVGANPNSDGRYSRSLNRMFAAGTPYRLFAEPHRAADRAAYALAKQWTAFEPAYAVGLLAAKADRLLTNERSLLYWPLYRQSVLRDGSGIKAWFDRHRAGIERVVDGFWYGLVAATVAGIVAAVIRRGRLALSILPLPLVLVGLYATFFAEARYHLAIVGLIFPFAAAGAVWVAEAARDLTRPGIDRARRRVLALQVGGTVVAVLVVFLGWRAMVDAGAGLRERHRWAVCVCSVEHQNRLCMWRRAPEALAASSRSSPSPIQGVWDGVGLRPAALPAAAETSLDLPAGPYRISFDVDVDVDVGAGGFPPREAALSLLANGVEVARAALSDSGSPAPFVARVTHGGGNLRLVLALSGHSFLRTHTSLQAVWISHMTVEREPG